MKVKMISTDHAVRMAALETEDIYMLVKLLPDSTIREMAMAECFVKITKDEEKEDF